jgi:hypothetical protein
MHHTDPTFHGTVVALVIIIVVSRRCPPKARQTLFDPPVPVRALRQRGSFGWRIA